MRLFESYGLSLKEKDRASFSARAGQLSALHRLAFILVATSPLLADDLSFTFTTESPGQSSGAIFSANGVHLKTLWSNQTLSAGEYSVTWDRLDAIENEVSDEDVSLHVLLHDVSYRWEGVVGNTGDEQTSDTKPRGFLPIADMSFSGSGEGFISTGYNEGQKSAHRFDQSSPNTWSGALPPDYRFATGAIASDNTSIYFARNPGSAPESFLYKKLIKKSNWRDPDGWLTEHATTAEISLGGEVKNVINAGTERCYGLAVQVEGELLAASYKEINLIRVFNKTSGEHLVDLAIENPRSLEFDAAGRLWVITGENKNANSVYTFFPASAQGAAPQLAIDGLSNALDLTFSPDGSSLLVVDGGINHQILAFDVNSRERLWSFGQEGGYKENGPSVTDDKFHFVNTIYGFESAFITYSPNGNLWVGDTGNLRTLVFSPHMDLLDEIIYIPHSYISTADLADATRIFSGWLEFEIDYSKPLAEGWKLARNWAGNVPYAMQKSNGIHTVATVATDTGPVTLAVADLPREGRWPPRAIVKLDPFNGLIDTGLDIPTARTAMYPGGVLRSYRNDKKASLQLIEEQKLAGFDGSGNPVWEAAEVIAEAPMGPQDPYYKNAFSSRSGPRFPETQSGKIIFFDQGRRDIAVNPGFHLGAVNRGRSTWDWRASYSGKFETIWDTEGREEMGRVINPTGDYDDETDHQYGGNRVMTAGNHVVYGYHGEFWRNGQANQWLHFTDDGLFVGQFGHPSYPWKGYPYEGVMGNAFSPVMVAYEDDIYLYMNDESVHGGVHRWKMEGLDSMQRFVINPSADVTEPSTPDELTSYSEWTAYFSLPTSDQGENTDADGDGINNLTEFIYRLQPDKWEPAPVKVEIVETSAAAVIVFLSEPLNSRPYLDSWEIAYDAKTWSTITPLHTLSDTSTSGDQRERLIKFPPVENDTFFAIRHVPIPETDPSN